MKSGTILRVLPLFVCGLAFLVITPPFQSPDEPEHFARIVQLSQFEIFASMSSREKSAEAVAILPKSVIDAIEALPNIRFDEKKKLSLSQLTQALAASPALDAKASNNRFSYGISSYALISPVPYLPQTIAVVFGRLLSRSPFELLYLARLGNLIFAMLLVALALSALEFSPRLRLAVFIMAGVPMNLFVMGTASNSSAIVAFTLCLIAVGANLRQKYTRRHFAWYLVLATAMSFSKSLYFGLPLVILPTIWSQARTSRARYQRVGLLLAACILPNLTWTLAAKGLYSPLRAGVDPLAGLMLALHHPLATLHVMLSSTKYYYTFYKETFIGRVGWHDVAVPYRMVKHYCHALLLVAFIAPRKGTERPWPKLHSFWVLLVTGTTGAMVYFTIFLTWNPLGATLIEGVQGRHFLPVFPFFFLAAWPVFKLKPLFWKIWQAGILGGWATAVVITLYCTFTRYWLI